MHLIIFTQVLVESKSHFRNVRFDHRSKAFGVRLGRQLVPLVELCHGYICRLESKLDIDKFLRVQVSVPVLCCCERCWESCATCIDGLPLVALIDTTCKLFNERRCKPLLAQSLVYAQEVDFTHLDALAIADHSDGDARNETTKFALSPDANCPLWDEIRWHKRPSEEFNGIIKAELALRVLHVVLCQQVVYFQCLVLIVKCDTAPTITIW